MSTTYFPILSNLILLDAGSCGFDVAREAQAVAEASDASLTGCGNRVDWALKVGAGCDAFTVQFAVTRVALAVIKASVASLAGDANRVCGTLEIAGASVHGCLGRRVDGCLGR
jgi:hypothetical protein